VLTVICYFLCLTTFWDSKALELSRSEIVITGVHDVKGQDFEFSKKPQKPAFNIEIKSLDL